MAPLDAVLLANEEFYRAFTDRDLEAMEAIWASGVPVSCIHPGWSALTGREETMESWQGILSGPEAPSITCRNAVAHVYGDTAGVVCYEDIEGSFLVATNAFHQQNGKWKIVHHQAGPTEMANEVQDDVPELLH